MSTIEIKTLPAMMEEVERRGWLEISNSYTFMQTIVCVCLYLGSAGFALWADRWFVWPIAWFVEAFLLVSCLMAVHDCVHCVHYKSSFANRIAGQFWGNAILMNASQYRYFHLDHHHYLGTEQDPEMERVGASTEVFNSLLDYLLQVPFLPLYYKFFWRPLFQMMLGQSPRYIRSTQQRRSVFVDNLSLVIWLAIVIYCSWAWPLVLLNVYWIPLLLYFPTTFFLVLPQHYGCESSDGWRNNTWSVRSNPLVSYLLFHINFHAAHHMLPRVPSQHLRKLTDLLDRDFTYTAPSYLQFHIRLIRQLFSKKMGKLSSWLSSN